MLELLDMLPERRGVHVRLRPRDVERHARGQHRARVVPRPDPGRAAQLPQAAAADERGVRVASTCRSSTSSCRRATRARRTSSRARARCTSATATRRCAMPGSRAFLEGEPRPRRRALAARPLLAAACAARPRRRVAARTCFVANSTHVAARIREVLPPRRARHPPAGRSRRASRAAPREPGDYYLVLGRVVPVQARRPRRRGVLRARAAASRSSAPGARSTPARAPPGPDSEFLGYVPRRRARAAAGRRPRAAVPRRGGLRDRAGRGAGRRRAGDRLRRRRRRATRSSTARRASSSSEQTVASLSDGDPAVRGDRVRRGDGARQRAPLRARALPLRVRRAAGRAGADCGPQA